MRRYWLGHIFDMGQLGDLIRRILANEIANYSHGQAEMRNMRKSGDYLGRLYK